MSSAKTKLCYYGERCNKKQTCDFAHRLDELQVKSCFRKNCDMMACVYLHKYMENVYSWFFRIGYKLYPYHLKENIRYIQKDRNDNSSTVTVVLPSSKNIKTVESAIGYYHGYDDATDDNNLLKSIFLESTRQCVYNSYKPEWYQRYNPYYQYCSHHNYYPMMVASRGLQPSY